MSTIIEGRVILVLRELGGTSGPWPKLQHGFWGKLANQTGIVATRWRKAYTHQQRPTPDMIEALCRLKPEYAFWIATGITDAENGHKAPATALPFPEWRGECASDAAAVDYFKISLEILDLLALAARVDVEDPTARLDAFGCVLVRGTWQPSPEVEAAIRELRREWTRSSTNSANGATRLAIRP